MEKGKWGGLSVKGGKEDRVRVLKLVTWRRVKGAKRGRVWVGNGGMIRGGDGGRDRGGERRWVKDGEKGKS